MKLLKNGRLFTALLFFSFLSITVLSCLPAIAEQDSKTAAVTTAPDFTLQDIKGSTVSLSQFRGQKPVLLYFWATWCHYCQAVRPAVISLRKATAQADIEIIAIDVGSGDSLAKLKRFEEADPAPYTVLYDTDSKVTRSYHIEGIPHFILVDKAGTIKYTGNQLPSDPVALLNSEGK
jgi:peroxiredoxin